MGTYIDIKTNRNIPTVANYSALPAPASAVNEYYWVLASQGTAWLPGGFGGTYYPLGLYYSNGTTWSHMETPVQATQIEVDAGINEDKFVAPKTLAESTYVIDFFIGILFEVVDTWTYVAPQVFQINTVDNPDGIVYTITVNALPYTLGNTINLYDVVEINGDIVGFLKLNCKLV